MATYQLATPDETRQAWIVKRKRIAAEVYMLNNPKIGDFTQKMWEAARIEKAGDTVFFPR
jgi:hypothetical protein